MLGLSGEHLLVLLVILLIFGPKRLPDLGHSIGRTLKGFKDAMNGNADSLEPEAKPVPQQIEKKTENTPESAKKAETINVES